MDTIDAFHTILVVPSSELYKTPLFNNKTINAMRPSIYHYLTQEHKQIHWFQTRDSDTKLYTIAQNYDFLILRYMRR